ncbi:glycosyltransferase family 4 protein [Wohlfahrtiimonas chitiniclastica]|uniref:glycosyltransferase family 4 protein n=1 Tax=Wohlfahrtiimonas chitiniclastica TaxID=400946 RepID=UPI000B9951BA|nr:glycosyltransferase family 4 protein [Wohlfahrtiimonas chitiniclastica]OYQ74959.1 glycosyltransferase family 1 protein [Wohlfahrtiimonas chitiniclastica]
MSHHDVTLCIIGTKALDFRTFRGDLIRMLVKQGVKVYALTCEYTQYDLDAITELGAIPMTYQMSRGGLNPFADLIALYKLHRQIKSLQPDVVLSFCAKPVVYGSLAAKWAKVPRVVGMLEGLGYAFTEQPEGLSAKAKIIRAIQIKLYQLALPKLDQLVLLNPDDQKDLIDAHHISVKALTILGGIGINLEKFPYSPAPTDPVRFIFIGRLLKEKGIFDYIAAMRLVKMRQPNAQFVILGGIDAQNKGGISQEVLDDLIQEGLFEYPGFVNNVSEWVRESSVFVLPSYREGVPCSTQEAMAIGRPVITTDVPGCRETVINDVNGFLVPKWNPEALAEKMLYFIEHPEKINEMGQASRKMAEEKFDAKKVNAKLCKLLGIEPIH